LICGPMKSGKSTALMSCAEALRDFDASRPMFLLSARPSVFTANPLWNHAVTGPEDCTALLQQLCQEMEVTPQPLAPVVFVDDFHELHEGSTGKALSALIALGKTQSIAIVATSDCFPARRASQYTPIGELRQFKRGLILNPDATQGDGDILGVLLPNASIKAWPVGRGYDVMAGGAELVQICIPN
jgi:DNA segregation ATPase FtsK/SpoIIIE, S-DNA-T family